MKTNPVPTPLPRIARFEKLGFGMFIHYGLYSQMGAGEWIQHARKIPAEEYAKLAPAFTAKGFDGRGIARLAREAGMRYACLTTRHHEGFSLYDTRGLNEFDAPHSPARRDLVAEFADGCRAEGIVPFFYHTTLDWRWDSDHCSEAKFGEYLDYLNASVEILCSHYGEIGGFWFDGNWSRPKSDWKEDGLYAVIRRHQPEAIIVNNTGLHARGALGHPELDSTTFEQGLPTAPDRTGWPKYLAGEMCETFNSHWGVGRTDFHFKSPATVIEHLCACRKTGANYLLNVGPRADGSIGEYEAAALRVIGRWVAGAGEAIFEGKPVAAQCQGRDFVLRAGDRFLYFAHGLNQEGSAHVVADGSGNGPRSITGLGQKIHSAKWVDDGKPIEFLQNRSGGLITLDCTGYDYGTNLVVRVAELTA
jgi:alpha-L-fucosidase